MSEVNFSNLKQLLIENCMLRISPDEIKEDSPLFGPESLGLDSIDALQITVAIEKNYGIVINNPDVARQAFRSLRALKEWLQAELAKSAK